MSVPDLSRVRFSLREFRRTNAIEDQLVLVRDPLATELEFSSLLEQEADAEDFGNFILGIRKEPRGNWTLEYVRGDEKYQIGDTVLVQSNRYGLSTAKSFLIKGIRRDVGPIETLYLFGPL